MQIADSAEMRGAANLIQGAIDTYQASLDFYSELADDGAEHRRSGCASRRTTRRVALLVSDRHDNIGMDATITGRRQGRRGQRADRRR